MKNGTNTSLTAWEASRDFKERSFARLIKEREITECLNVGDVGWEIRAKCVVSQLMKKEEAIALAKTLNDNLFLPDYPDGTVQSRDSQDLFRVILDPRALKEKMENISFVNVWRGI